MIIKKLLSNINLTILAMSNQNLLRPNREQIFGSNIPMRKSIIISDVNDLDRSASTIRANRRKTQMFETRKGSFVLSTVAYPGPTFLALKVKRILQFHLTEIFKKVKDYRKKIINLNLLQAKSKKHIVSAFFSLKLYDKLHKGEKLGQVIQRNKRPHLIYYEVARVVKRNYKEVLTKLFNLKRRGKNIEQFLILLQRITKKELRPFFYRVFMRKLKSVHSLYSQKMEGATRIFRTIPKVMRRLKLISFRNVISGLKVKQLQSVSIIKKDSACKMNETSTERARTLNTQRQKIRNIKNSLDLFSADRSKARYEIRRDINTQRNKMKEEEKKSKAIITQLSNENKSLQNQLDQIFNLNSKRLSRIKSLKGLQFVQDLFNYLQGLESNQLGEVQPKQWTKQTLAGFNKQVQVLDEFHTQRNQRLRQELFEYENMSLSKKTIWPTEQLIIDENKNLKEMIQCILLRALDKAATRQRESLSEN